MAFGGHAYDAADLSVHKHVEQLNSMDTDIGQHTSALFRLVMPTLYRIL